MTKSLVIVTAIAAGIGGLYLAAATAGSVRAMVYGPLSRL